MERKIGRFYGPPCIHITIVLRMNFLAQGLLFETHYQYSQHLHTDPLLKNSFWSKFLITFADEQL